MSIRKRLKDFRDWCPQPPNHFPSKLKHYSAPIAILLTVTLFAASFSMFYSSSVFHPSVPLAPALPISASVQSSDTIYIGPSNTIYIRPDGSIDPSTAPIKQVGNVYTLTGNIASNNGTAIEVQKDNIIIDGSDYTLQGPGTQRSLNDALTGSIGIVISNGNNVTVENFLITNALVGIDLENSANSQLIQNSITTYSYENGIDVFNSSNNAISNNNIVSYANLDGCQNNGLDLSNSFNITVSKNNVVGSWVGISLGETNSSVVSGNSVTQSCTGIGLFGSDVNQVFGNKVFGTIEAISHGDYPDSGTGITLYSKADNNQVYENELTNNGYGLNVWFGSSNNTIYDNNFENNSLGQVNLLLESGVSNFWDNGTIGNYWSDYRGQGTYVIDQNNVDYHPLTHPTLLSTILPIAIIAIVAVVIVAAVVFLMFQKRLKTKTKNPSTTPQNSTSISSIQICFKK
jgi:parallel beta-helix repeat protein